MRLDASFVPAIFAQVADAPLPPHMTGLGAVVFLLGGSGGLVMIVKYLVQPLAEHLKAKREREAQERAEEQERRRERHTAELDQIRVVTSLASSVPAALDKLATETRASTDALVHEVRAGFAQMRDAMTPMVRAVESNTNAVDALTGHVVSETHDKIDAIAERTGAAKTRRQPDDAPRSTGPRPRLPSTPL
jgi:hypothetical protein